MEYLVGIFLSLLFWLPFYLAAIYSWLIKKDITKKFVFGVTCLILSYGTIGLIIPVLALLEITVTFFIHEWHPKEYEQLIMFFIKANESSYILAFLILVISSFVVPFKLGKLWDSIVSCIANKSLKQDKIYSWLFSLRSTF